MSDQALIYGLHAVQAALDAEPSPVRELWVDSQRNDRRIERIVAAAQLGGVAVRRVPGRELDELAGGAAHQGVIARCQAAPALQEEDLFALLDRLDGPALLLVLDGVQDPHNLGACLRTADAAGVHAVIVPRDRAVGLTPVVRKVASGAAEHVPFVQVTNLARTLRRLQEAGVWLVGTAGEAPQSVFEADLNGPLAVLLGAEGAGLRRLTREHCDFLVRIPMAGTVESLNVSVAAGVCLFEAVRQRTAAGRT